MNECESTEIIFLKNHSTCFYLFCCFDDAPDVDYKINSEKKPY